MRITRSCVSQAHQRQHLLDAVCFIGTRPLTQTETHISGHAQMREERVVLKDHTNLPPFGRQLPALLGHPMTVQGDTTATQRLESGDRPQHRGLTAARTTQQTTDLTWC